MQICSHTSDNHPPVILQIYQTIFDAAVMSTSVLSKDNTSVSTVLLFTASSNMSLAERVYFTILIPVTLIILITIMAYYTVEVHNRINIHTVYRMTSYRIQYSLVPITVHGPKKQAYF